MPSPSFLYNPYSSTQPSLENVLQKLPMSSPPPGGGPPSMATVESLLPQLKQFSNQWNFDLALSFSSYVFGLFQNHRHDLSSNGNNNNSIPKGSLAVLHLLTMVMQEWEDDVLYAILVHQDDSSGKQQQIKGSCNKWIELFINLVHHPKPQHQDIVQKIALVGLSLACQVLDRIQTLTTLDLSFTDAPWWLAEDDAMNLSSYGLRIVLNSNMATDSRTSEKTISPDKKQVKLAALSVLLTLFKHDMASFLNDMSNEQAVHLCRELLVATQVLVDATVTPQDRYCIPIALTSASLLCMIKSKSCLDMTEYDRMMQTSDMIETVTQSTFAPPNDPSRSRWATQDESNNEWTYQFAIETIRCWNITQNDEWSIFEKLESKWIYFVGDFWAGVLQNSGNRNQLLKDMPSIFFLHTTNRLQARNSMIFSLSRLPVSRQHDVERHCEAILTALLQMVDNPIFSVRIHAARLIWIFLSDRRNVATHDELSRHFWAALTGTMIDSLVSKLLDLATTDDLQQPGLVALLDILDIYIKFQDNIDTVLNKLGAEGIEGLIHVVDPTSIKVDYMESFYEETQVDSQTPPANNLSYIDQRSICLEQEEVKEPRGIDNAVRLAAATFLARLCYSPQSSNFSDNEINVLRARMSTAVNDFLIDYQQMDDSLEGVCHSLNLNKRLFRLKLTMSTPDNEDFVLTMEHTNKKLQRRRLFRLMEDNKKIQEELSRSLQREQQLENEKKQVKERYHSLSILSKREMVRKEKKATQQAQQFISVHAAERSRAESQISEALENAKRHENELHESQKRESELDEKLRESMTRTAEIEALNAKLCEQANAKDKKLDEYHGELTRRTEALETAEGNCKTLESQLHNQNETMGWAEDANERLRENLEDLFADMSSLAQVYSFKEEEEATSKESYEKHLSEFQRKLKEEKTKSEDFSTELEKYKDENHKLYRKLEKYKLKIEEERREREEETRRRKRNGPVSYINQLHNSSHFSDKNTSRNQSIRTESSKHRSRDESMRSELSKSSRHGSSAHARKRDKSEKYEPQTSRRREESQSHEKENTSNRYKMSSSQPKRRYY